MKPTKDDVVPKALQNQLGRLFGVDSKEARSKTRSLAAWRKTLKHILTELDQYRAANVDTDSLHNFMLDCALASASNALKLPNFWPGYVEGVVRFALCLMGDYPDHHARKSGKRRDNHYKLDSHRSIVFLQTSKQQSRTLFMASALKVLKVPHPFWEVMAAFRDKYGYAASERQFMMWFKKAYPEAYATVF